MADIGWLDATGQAALVREGEASPEELLDVALARLAAVNPQLNAVIHPLRDRARRQVPQIPADAPFRGVPMVLKDLLQELAGEPFHEGMQYLRNLDYRPPATSELATRFETAGLVVRHNFEENHSVFERSTADHHDHMVCIDTGEVTEFISEEIERLQHEIAERYGYELIDHSLVLYVKTKTED